MSESFEADGYVWEPGSEERAVARCGSIPTTAPG